MTKAYFANFYDISVAGFYFDTIEELQAKLSTIKAEEYDVSCVSDMSELFDACSINQTNLSDWLDYLSSSTDLENATVSYLVGVGVSFEDAVDQCEDVQIVESTLIDASTEQFNENYTDLPDYILMYIDYAKIANDCRLSGDMHEFNYEGKTYTILNANEF